MIMYELHSHMCPLCFRYVPCDMDCKLYGDEPKDENGLKAQHPALCDDCGSPSAMLRTGFDPISMGM